MGKYLQKYPALFSEINSNNSNVSDKAFLSFNFEHYCNILNEALYPKELLQDMLQYESFYYLKYPDKKYSFSYHTPEYEKSLLYEGLTFSVDTTSAALQIRKELSKICKQYQKQNDNIALVVKPEMTGEIYVGLPLLNIDDINKIYELLHPTLNQLGYFISKHYKENHKFFKIDYDVLIIEAKFNIEKTADVYKTGILYHIAPERVKHKILAYGLYPKSKSKKVYHPERIYCLTYMDLEKISNLSNDLKNHDNFPEYLKNNNISNRMCLFKINLNKHPHKIEFFLDPAYPNNGVYTLENISPDCIEFLQYMD